MLQVAAAPASILMSQQTGGRVVALRSCKLGAGRRVPSVQQGGWLRWERTESRTSQCQSSMSFNNGSSAADSGFSENDEDYVDSTVVEAGETCASSS